MAAITCRVPLTVRLHGVPDEDRLAHMASEVAFTVAEVLARADRAMALREGGAGRRKVYQRPTLRLLGRELDSALASRVEQELRAAVLRALAPAPGDPVAEGVRPGSEPRDGQVFWDALRSQLRVSAYEEGARGERAAAVALAVDGIRHSAAQVLILEALQHPSAGLRVAMMDALARLRHDLPVARHLLLRGLVRHGDTVGLSCFDGWMDQDPDGMLRFLAETLEGTLEPDRGRSAQVLLHYLDGQYQAARARQRPTFDRLRALAHRHSLFGSGPHGVDALRARLADHVAVVLAVNSVRGWELQALLAAAGQDGVQLDALDAQVARDLAAAAALADAQAASGAQDHPAAELRQRARRMAGLLEAGHPGVWRYDPARVPVGLKELARAVEHVAGAESGYARGTLVARSGARLLLFVGAGPVPAGLARAAR